MGSNRQSVKARLSEYLAGRRGDLVSEQEWREIRRLFAPASLGYLRRLLRASGAPLAPLVEGIRQDSFENLERTLLAVEEEYRQARAEGDIARQKACRRAVVDAKDHARWSIRRSGAAPEDKAAKEEMVAWMLVWLENPEVFPAWVKLRKGAVDQRNETAQPG